MSTAEKSKDQEIWEAVRGIVEADGLSITAALDKWGSEHDMHPASVAKHYYAHNKIVKASGAAPTPTPAPSESGKRGRPRSGVSIVRDDDDPKANPIHTGPAKGKPNVTTTGNARPLADVVPEPEGTAPTERTPEPEPAQGTEPTEEQMAALEQIAQDTIPGAKVSPSAVLVLAGSEKTGDALVDGLMALAESAMALAELAEDRALRDREVTAFMERMKNL